MKTFIAAFKQLWKIQKGLQSSWFRNDIRRFKKLSSKKQRFSITWRELVPCIKDKTSMTGFDKHYIYHPAWAARIIAKENPSEHIDISSTLHFCSIVSAFVPIKFYDYRPAKLNLTNLESQNADLLNLPFENNSIKSLSCMHTVEHVGLGRYGDTLDPDGDLKSIDELKRVLDTKGNLLFVVPIGKPRIMFNAHRVYSYNQILSYFSDLELKEFSLVTDNPKSKQDFIYNASKEDADMQSYGCGCFWFIKK